MSGFDITCPRCQGICPPGETVCGECGCRLGLSVPERLAVFEAGARPKPTCTCYGEGICVVCCLREYEQASNASV